MEKKKILLVDDEKDLILLNKVMLEAHGYEIVSANDGKEALEVVTSEKPDLIIMDIKMPVMDGYEALTRLKKDLKTKSIPVIMLTALGDSESLFKAECLEASEYVTKSFESQDLLELIKRYI